MQDLRSCFFTNEFLLSDKEGNKIDLEGNVHFLRSKIDNLTICHLVVDDGGGYLTNAVGRDVSYNDSPLEAQRGAFRDALRDIAEIKEWEICILNREEVEV